jgi:Zn-dependent M16 (insulinase) family peptidase
MSDTSNAFELVKETEIAEYKTMARLFRHKRTGAELLSLENDDTNKVFGVSLPNPAPRLNRPAAYPRAQRSGWLA